jgi:hypothetical protein
MMRIVVEAFWDGEARVWVASSLAGIGLATEAPTIEELQRKLSVMIPDLLDGEHAGTVEIELVARSLQTIAA